MFGSPHCCPSAMSATVVVCSTFPYVPVHVVVALLYSSLPGSNWRWICLWGYTCVTRMYCKLWCRAVPVHEVSNSMSLCKMSPYGTTCRFLRRISKLFWCSLSCDLGAFIVCLSTGFFCGHSSCLSEMVWMAPMWLARSIQYSEFCAHLSK